MKQTLQIQSPWWGLLLIVMAAGLFLAWRRRRPALRVSSLTPFRAAIAEGGMRRRVFPRLPLLIYAVGMTCLVVALMRPRLGIEHKLRQAEGIDIMLALDVSGSMEAYDLDETYKTRDDILRAIEEERLQQRIEIARQELIRFIQERPDDRVGLIAFAQYPYVVCPPTLDHDFLLRNLEEMETGLFRDMTGIAGPIASAANRLKGSDAKRRVLVLFTDGENNVRADVSPLQAAKLAETFDVAVYTVGIGSRRAVMISDTPWGEQVRQVRAWFNEELLEKIADITGGRYFEARDAESFRQVMLEIDDLEKTTLEQPVYTDYREYFLPWLMAGIMLCFAGFLLDKTILQDLP